MLTIGILLLAIGIWGLKKLKNIKVILCEGSEGYLSFVVTELYDSNIKYVMIMEKCYFM